MGRGQHKPHVWIPPDLPYMPLTLAKFNMYPFPVITKTMSRTTFSEFSVLSLNCQNRGWSGKPPELAIRVAGTALCNFVDGHLLIASDGHTLK